MSAAGCHCFDLEDAVKKLNRQDIDYSSHNGGIETDVKFLHDYKFAYDERLNK